MKRLAFYGTARGAPLSSQASSFYDTGRAKNVAIGHAPYRALIAG